MKDKRNKLLLFRDLAVYHLGYKRAVINDDEGINLRCLEASTNFRLIRYKWLCITKLL